MAAAAAAESPPPTGQHRCGCCNRLLPASEVHELGGTPGVFICVGCALWIVRQVGLAPALRQVRFTPLGAAMRRLGHRT